MMWPKLDNVFDWSISQRVRILRRERGRTPFLPDLLSRCRRARVVNGPANDNPTKMNPLADKGDDCAFCGTFVAALKTLYSKTLRSGFAPKRFDPKSPRWHH